MHSIQIKNMHTAIKFIMNKYTMRIFALSKVKEVIIDNCLLIEKNKYIFINVEITGLAKTIK
jgi:hypothetical protein